MSFDFMGPSSAIATQNAAKLGAKAAIYAANLQQNQYMQTRADMYPWLNRGEWAGGELASKISKGPGEYEKSPYYDFLQKEGVKTREMGAASKGMLESGAEQKELTRFGEGLASQDYDTWLNRWYQSLTPYQSMSGLGQTTGGQLGALGAQSAQAQGNFLNQAGQMQAAGYLGAANAMGQSGSYNMNALSNIGQNVLQNRQANQGLTQQSNTISYGMGTLGNPGAGNIGFTGAEMSNMTWL